MFGIVSRARALKSASDGDQIPSGQDKKSDKSKKKEKKQKEHLLLSEEDPLLSEKASAAPADATMKNAMASERTYMKWVWTALRLGAIGTFLLTVFSRQEELALIIAIWAVALGFMGLGLWQFYKRRNAMLLGLEQDVWDDGGCAIYSLVFATTAIFICVFYVLLAY